MQHSPLEVNQKHFSLRLPLPILTSGKCFCDRLVLSGSHGVGKKC